MMVLNFVLFVYKEYYCEVIVVLRKEFIITRFYFSKPTIMVRIVRDNLLVAPPPSDRLRL